MINPMVARLVRDPFDRDDWLFELKWDVFRAIAETDGQRAVKLYSRNHNDFKKRFPLIAQALAELGRPAFLDGEIVALRFEWLVNRGPQQGTLIYYVFDLLSLDGKDLVSCHWNRLDWRSCYRISRDCFTLTRRDERLVDVRRCVGPWVWRAS